MLQTIRSKTSGVVVKGLFILLVASFAIWGIGNYDFLRRNEQTAIQVGDVKISADRLSNEYRRELDRLRRTFGQFDPEIARQFGLMDQVVDRLINESVLDQETARLGIIIGDDVVRARIAADPNFRGMGDRFDPNVFRRALQENGYSEGQYVDILRRELARAALIESIALGGRAPDILVDRLYRHREERRTGEIVLVRNDAMEGIGEPDGAQLKSVYDDNTERFNEPEFRTVTALRIGVDEIAATIKPTDDQIKEEYEARLSELRVPERRDVENMVFQSEDAAKAAAAKVAAGTPFVDVAREAAQQTPEQTKIDGVEKRDLFPELAEPVFAAAEGAIIGPIKSALGWHVARVSKIYPGHEPTLAEVREKIVHDVAQRLAGDAAYKAAVAVEDALASGATLEEAASRVNLKTAKIEAVNAQGATPAGTPEPTFAGAPEAVQSAFQMNQGETSQLIETRGGTYFFERVDSITPTRVKTLDEVRPQVVALWQTQQRAEAAQERAETIVERAKDGALGATASTFGLKTETTPPVRRDGSGEGQTRVPAEVAGQLFTLKQGEMASVVSRDGTYVVRLTEIRPADPAADPEGVARLRQELGQQIGGDLIREYASALRARYGVSTDPQAIERITRT